MKYSSIFLVLLVLLSCHSNNKKPAGNDFFSSNNKTDSLNSISLAPLSFFDSIAGKHEFSAKQIRGYTKIDSIYYTGIFADAVFTGDSIFALNNDYKVCIIGYDDRRSCIYKFLLVYSSKTIENTDHRIIFSECDFDPSSDYTSMQYKILTDSTFETIEFYTPAGSDEDHSRIKKNKIKWRVNNKGLIDSVLFR